ncbi:hypothetical protein CBL_12809 [Carabus blaptoides fortunei]
MKRHQSGAEKRKKLKKNLEFVEGQRNALHKFVTVNSETKLPSTSTSHKLSAFETSSEPQHRSISEQEKNEKQVEHQEVENATDKSGCEDEEERDSPDKLLNIDIEEKEKEECYSREVLKRIVSTIKLLSRLGLGFRGTMEAKIPKEKEII